MSAFTHANPSSSSWQSKTHDWPDHHSVDFSTPAGRPVSRPCIAATRRPQAA